MLKVNYGRRDWTEFLEVPLEGASTRVSDDNVSFEIHFVYFCIKYNKSDEDAQMSLQVFTELRSHCRKLCKVILHAKLRTICSGFKQDLGFRSH